MITHPLRRSTDWKPNAVGHAAQPRIDVSLVVVVRPGMEGPAWLSDGLPDFVDEVVVVNTAPDGPSTWPGDAGSLRGEQIILMDGDGTMSPHDIPHYLHYLGSGFDLVKGSRFIAGGESLSHPFTHRYAHRLLLRLTHILYGQQLTDLWSGMCAFRRPFLEALPLHGDPVGIWPQTVVHALHYGLRVVEVPSHEMPGEVHVQRHTFQDGIRVLALLWRERPRNTFPRLLTGHRVPHS
ncbi:glycosyltransferase [Streptomyces sp. NPDC016309]|uniref:glycosyltransferase n=1 Tax=Streptomyces sp. NPDC016309 TaxID=3364965 RepID=UPI0036FB4097